MSMSIPSIPSLPPPAYHAWVRPVAQASFWLSLVLTIYFVLQGLVLWPLHNLALWRLVESEVQHQQLHSLIWLLAPLGARYFAKDPGVADWFVIYGLIVIANLISESSVGLLQIFDRFRRMALLNVIQSLVTLAIIAFVYVNQGGFLGILLAYLAGKVIGALGLTA